MAGKEKERRAGKASGAPRTKSAPRGKKQRGYEAAAEAAGIAPSTVDVPWLEVPQPMDRKAYEKELFDLQVQLVRAQNWVRETGQRVIVLMEGRDSAGKGGTLDVLMEHLNPRFARRVALGVPNETEKGQWYFQRYIAHLPTRGEMVFFDRSWYNRAGVEVVMGFAQPDETARFLRQAPQFEEFLQEEGIYLFKIWLEINPEEQIKRLASRATHPLKQWKLSPMDKEAPRYWQAYTQAALTMFLATDTPAAHWWLVNNNDKRTGRLNVARLLLHHLPYPDKDPAVARPPDPAIVAEVRTLFPLIRRRKEGEIQGPLRLEDA